MSLLKYSQKNEQKRITYGFHAESYGICLQNPINFIYGQMHHERCNGNFDRTENLF